MSRLFVFCSDLLNPKEQEALMTRANILGDIRAEADTEMLNLAFFETPDFRTLIESGDRSVIVGRRGTGKSAIAYRLNRHFLQDKKTALVSLATEEDQVFGLRTLVSLFGDKFKSMRAGTRIAWRYALLMEIANLLAANFKVKKDPSFPFVDRHLARWRSPRRSVPAKISAILQSVTDKTSTPEARISDLAHRLELRELEDIVERFLESSNIAPVVLIDKLDEGYEPDDIGIGLVDGIVQAAIDTKTKFAQVRAYVFLRDNIFRAVARLDPDYSRNIEGQVLRLHWDEAMLFNLVCNRLRVAFKLDVENAVRLWNRCANRELEGRDGFRKCLRLTLYRPRDVLGLLNEAFLNAAKHDRQQIVGEDIDITAKAISSSRLDDLHKEYSTIFPGLPLFTAAFANRSPELSVADAAIAIQEVMREDKYTPEVQQQMAILHAPIEVVRDLYGVGFIGILDPSSKNYVFCHDGRDPNKEFADEVRVLVHPCYWMALNATREILEQEQAEQIYDEYDIEIASETPEQRAKRIGQIIGALQEIPEGHDGFAEFEEWCHRAIQIVFAGALRNVELHPNRSATQRRDVVATNLGETKAWKRIYESYRSRQVIFEIKNYRGLGSEEYRQMLSYLTGEYGRLGFIVNRDDDIELRKEGDLAWMKEMHDRHNVLVVKLTAKYFCGLLSKLRNPQKHDSPEKAIHKLLDKYERLYVGGVSEGGKKRS